MTPFLGAHPLDAERNIRIKPGLDRYTRERLGQEPEPEPQKLDNAAVRDVIVGAALDGALTPGEARLLVEVYSDDPPCC